MRLSVYISEEIKAVTCDRVRTRLGAYVDHELPAKQAAEFELHLRSCEACAQELDRLTQLASLLREDVVSVVSSSLAARIVLQGQQQLSGRKRIHIPPVLWWDALPSYMRAAAVIVLMVGISMGTLLGMSVSKRAEGPVAVSITPDSDPALAIHLDYFTDSPSGSPAQAYLALATPPSGEGR
jgi:anti-sigma factor RsiW